MALKPRAEADPGPGEAGVGAGHLFEEPGALERVGQLAANWFANHLLGPGA